MTAQIRQFRRALIAGLALFVGGMLALSAYTLWVLRTEAINDGLEIARMHARSFESFLTQNLRNAEMAAVNAAQIRSSGLDAKAAEAAFVAALRQAPFLRSLSLLDENDRIVLSSNPRNVGLTVACADYLPPAAGGQDILRIGPPWSGRDFVDGQVTSPQRPAPADAQSFIPVVKTVVAGERSLRFLVALNSDYFVNHFSQTLEPMDGSVEVLRYDGILLMDTSAETYDGSLHEFVPRNIRLSEEESGKFLQEGSDGQGVLTAFQASRLYPIVVVVHRPLAAALLQWQSEAKVIVGVVVPALLLIGLLAAEFLRRQMQFVAQRTEAERLQRLNATVFEASAEAIIITDLHGDILSVNSAFCSMTGYSAEEAIGKNPRLLSSGRHDKSFYENLWNTLLREGVWHGEVVNRRKDGSLFDARLSITVSRDGEGRLQHFIGDLWDITERKTAEAAIAESRNLLLTVINTAPLRVFWKDRDLRYIGCNIGFARDAGMADPADVVGKDDFQMAWAAQAELYRADDRAVIETGGSKLFYDEPQTTPDGQTIWLRTSKVALRDQHQDIVGLLGIYEDITDYKDAQRALKVSEEKFRRAFYLTPDALNINRLRDGLYVSINHGFTQVSGYTEEDVIGRTSLEFNIWNNPQDRVRLVEGLKKDGVVTNLEASFRAKDGHVWDGLMSAATIEVDGVPHLISVTRDISERKKAEEDLRLAASVFANSREGIMITATDGSIVDVNAAFTEITGYPRDEVLGRNPRILSSGRQGSDYYAAMWRGLIEKGHWYGEIWNRRKSGEVYAEMQTISTVRDAMGNAQHYVSLFSDISVYKAHQRQLEHIAHYDALTGLPNRVLLADRMHQGIAQVQRRKQLMAVAFLDLDGFKAINDSHGHEAGDQMLIALASRMKQGLREGDTLARLGGDEFVAVLLDLPDVESTVPLLTRLLAVAAQPVLFADALLQVSASVGVTFFPQADDVDADQLLRQADQAMYEAKLAGKNRYHIFDAEQDRSVRGHHEGIETIRQALQAQEFELYFQPKVNMRSGKAIGAEALIRWHHPQRGLLLPNAFLPVIEEHPLAIDIGEWVIHTALAQIARWRAMGLHLPVSVNISARQLQQLDFTARLQGILADHPDVQPGDLELEVLETSALEDLTHVSAVIEECRTMGVLFALDDFGTGYSSLTYLKHLPVTQLKIDQSFVLNMLDDPDDLTILEGVVGLASAFHRQVLAEGVESVAQGTLLLQLGCELAQGFGIARPMPAHAIPQWAANWRTAPAWTQQSAVSRDDFPVLFAGVAHRAWVAAFAAFIRGEREAAPALDMHQCHFGMWLQADGAVADPVRPGMQSVTELHQQVHALAEQLMEMRQHGRQPEAVAGLPTLYALRDALLARLTALQTRATA